MLMTIKNNTVEAAIALKENIEIVGAMAFTYVKDSLAIALGAAPQPLPVFDEKEERRWYSRTVNDSIADGQLIRRTITKYKFDEGDGSASIHVALLRPATSVKVDLNAPGPLKNVKLVAALRSDGTQFCEENLRVSIIDGVLTVTVETQKWDDFGRIAHISLSER